MIIRSLLKSLCEHVERVELIEAIPKLEEEQVIALEEEIDKMGENLPEMKNFILPGGAPLISHTHIARSVCRRTERSVVALMETEQVDEHFAQRLLNLFVGGQAA